MKGTRLIGGLIMWLVVIPNLVAAPRAELWPRWTKHEPSSIRTIDHSLFQRFLQAYLVQDNSGINRVRYGAVTLADRALLARYIQDLEAVNVSLLNRNEQLAFWLNLYNARTLLLVLEHYPVKSILDIKFQIWDLGPWDQKLITVEGERLSLNDIEHRILRPIWRDPRLHYVVNCASLGCPNLQPQPFTSANVELLMSQAAREYIAHPRAVLVKGNELRLSSIWQWFQTDFAPNEAGVLLHIRRYANAEIERQLAAFRGRIWYDYDWSLNEAP